MSKPGRVRDDSNPVGQFRFLFVNPGSPTSCPCRPSTSCRSARGSRSWARATAYRRNWLGMASGLEHNLMSETPMSTPGGVFLLRDPSLPNSTWNQMFNTGTVQPNGTIVNQVGNLPPAFQIQ